MSFLNILFFSGSSSPDDAGFVSTAGNKGSSVSTPGTVRSTPSSEALDVVGDLRYESMRFRSLPVSHKNDTYSKVYLITLVFLESIEG